jgi:hypothetical protein
VGSGESPMTTFIDYRQLVRRLRPARVCTMIPGEDLRWHANVLRMIENYSITWGGSHSAIVPVGGDGEVNDRYWPLIERFDADLWGVYQQTPSLATFTRGRILDRPKIHNPPRSHHMMRSRRIRVMPVQRHFWRKGWDLNPRLLSQRTLSRRVPLAARAPFRSPL